MTEPTTRSIDANKPEDVALALGVLQQRIDALEQYERATYSLVLSLLATLGQRRHEAFVARGDIEAALLALREVSGARPELCGEATAEFAQIFLDAYMGKLGAMPPSRRDHLRLVATPKDDTPGESPHA